MYYFAVLDCNGNMEKTFNQVPKNMPRVVVHWTMTNSENENDDQFSYEDVGSYNLSWWLCVVQVALGAFIIRAYLKNIKDNERYLSPHPIMLMSIAS